MKNDCLFCKIVAGEIPANKVYEDKNFLAFLDVNPVNQGHTLIIPKKHSRNILEIDDETFKEMMPIVKKLSEKIKTALNADGINIIINNEPAAGQIIFHTHIHIIPRFANDGLRHWPGGKYTEGEAEIIAKKIKEE
ncbi:MAG: HIT family protein [Candidatus Pacebacteria bacterium]|nr:HIT family protein [Candidatus Paceibacterota bacterium]